MSSDLTISPLGLKLIKAYEGFTARPKRLITGQFVVGYGHGILSEQMDAFEQEPLTRERAEEILRDDINPYEIMVRDGILAPLSQNQFDALCCLAFNIGEEKFMGSNVRHALNNGRILDAANSFDQWRKAEIGGYVYVIDILMRRRTAEKALFLRGSHYRANAGRYTLEALPDESVVNISEEEHYFDPDSGIVDQVPYEATANPARRREDSPLGFFGLSEVEYDEEQIDSDLAKKRKAASMRSVFSPVTRSFMPDVEQSTEPSLRVSADDDIDRDLAHEANLNAEGQILDQAVAVTKIEDDNGGTLLLENKISENFVASLEGDSVLDIPAVNLGPVVDSEANNLRNDSDDSLQIEDSQTPSPIAIAAAEVSERLDALIDKSKLEADAPKVGISVSEQDPIKGVTKSLPRETNVVELTAANDAVKPAAEMSDASLPDSASTYIQKDIRLKDGAQGKVFGAYALMMIIGGCMLAGGLVMWLTNQTGLDDLTSLLVPLCIFVGAIMVLGAFYYMLRGKLRHS